jgi:hypothetical protein
MNAILEPVVDCKMVRTVLLQARELVPSELAEFLSDLEVEPDVGPVVVAEVRAHLQLGTP